MWSVSQGGFYFVLLVIISIGGAERSGKHIFFNTQLMWDPCQNTTIRKTKHESVCSASHVVYTQQLSDRQTSHTWDLMDIKVDTVSHLEQFVHRSKFIKSNPELSPSKASLLISASLWEISKTSSAASCSPAIKYQRVNRTLQLYCPAEARNSTTNTFCIDTEASIRIGDISSDMQIHDDMLVDLQL